MAHPILPPTREAIAGVFDRLKDRPVRVHALTSPVAAERTANTLLALGVRPSLTVNPDEIVGFIEQSDACLINLGMLDATREAAIAAALPVLSGRRRWVLDPVFVDVSGSRRALARRCLAAAPAVLKANAAEAALIAEAPPATVTVATGAEDQLRQGARRLGIANGHPLAGRVTAMGCALGGVIAACLAVEEDAFLATATALAAYGVAIERAARTAPGPGRFAAEILDELAFLDGRTLLEEARLTCPR